MHAHEVHRASCGGVSPRIHPPWASRPLESLRTTCTRQIGARTKSQRLSSSKSTKVGARLPPRRSIWLTFIPYPPAKFDADTWNTFPETRQATDFSSLPVPLDPEGPTQGTRVPVDPPIDFNSFGNMNAQILREQMSYATDINHANDLRNTSFELVPALGLPGYIPITNIGPLCSNENTGGLINVPNLMMAANSPSSWANPLSRQSNAIAAGCENNGSGVPACNGLNIKSSSLRIRGVRSPPQTYEGNVGRLCDRLIHEGADISTVMFLRYVIFATEVTVDALLAPLQPSEVVHVCDGANRMWKMLLEMKEVTPGEKKFCCLLCPVGNRREYRYGRDAVRHFNKDHFGFSYPCEYW